MAERILRQNLQAALFDRLTDEEPRNRNEAAPSIPQAMAQIKANLRRDIEWLLNTRRAAVEPPFGARYLPESVYYFGLPDLTGAGLGAEEAQTEFARLIEEAVTIFEPRLRSVSVTILPAVLSHRLLRFQIEGLLRIEPGPERIQFDTVLELSSGSYKVERTGA